MTCVEKGGLTLNRGMLDSSTVLFGKINYVVCGQIRLWKSAELPSDCSIFLSEVGISAISWAC